MANLANLLATIAANVYTNHNNEVTAQMVKDALGAIVSTMGQGGYIYKGLATTSTNPSSPDANVFYIATAAGTYTNFGGIVVNAGEVAILKGTGTSWSKDVTGAATVAKLTELEQKVGDLDNLTTTSKSNLVGAINEIDSEVSGQNQEIADFEETITNQIDNFQPIVIEGNVVNAPDEEDITTDSNDLLKFANRGTLHGMGYVILRRDATFADQVTLTNTIYEIRYDFDLGGASVTIPAGCVLRFNGGKLTNGTISGQETKIAANFYQIFDATIAGTWIVPYISPEWFGAKGDGVTDDTTALKKTISCAISCGLNFKANKRTYLVSDSLNIDSADGQIFDFSDCLISVSDFSGFNSVTIHGTSFRYHILMISDCKNSIVKNLFIEAATDNTRDCIAISVLFTRECVFNNLNVKGISKDALYISGDSDECIFDGFHSVNLGTRTNAADIYQSSADNSCKIYYHNVTSHRQTFGGGQLFYLSRGTNTIDLVYAENVPYIIDQRSGYCLVDNVNAKNVGPFLVRTDAYSGTPVNIKARNIHYINVQKYENNITNVLSISACSSAHLENIIFDNIASDLYALQIRKYSGSPTNDVRLKEITFNAGDSGVILGYIDLNSIEDNVYFERVTIKAPGVDGTHDHIRVNNVPLDGIRPIIFMKDVVITGGRAQILDWTNSRIHYMERCVEKSTTIIGPSSVRPIGLLGYEAGVRFYDSDVTKLLIWNGTIWVDTSGARATWPVTFALTNLSATYKGQANVGASYSTKLVPAAGYSLPTSITIKFYNTTLTDGTDYTYDSATGEISILGIGGSGGVTNVVTITAAAV